MGHWPGTRKVMGPTRLGEGLGFVSVGATLAGGGALVRPGLEGLLALDAHGFVDEQAQTFGKGIVALLDALSLDSYPVSVQICVRLNGIKKSVTASQP